MPLLSSRKQLMARISDATTFNSSTIDPANVREGLTECSYTPNVTEITSNVLRAQIGASRVRKAARSAQIQSTFEVRGNTTDSFPTVPPNLDVMLRSAGFQKITRTGTASVGTLVKGPNNAATQEPAITGTYGGTADCTLIIEITAVSTDTSIDFTVTKILDDDLATTTSASFSQTGASAVSINSIAAGLSFDFGNPDSTTAGYEVGQKWGVELTGTEEAVVYRLRDSGFETVDLAYNMDGNLRRLHAGASDMTFSASITATPTMQFTTTGAEAGIGNTATITGATNASPIVVTVSDSGEAANWVVPDTGTEVIITDVAGNTAANGTFTITKLTSSTFSLGGSTGSGAYTSGGTVKWQQPFYTTGLTNLADAVQELRSVTASDGGDSPGCFTQFTLALNNTVALRPCAAETSGYEGAFISARRVTFQYDPEALPVTDTQGLGDERDPLSDFYGDDVRRIVLRWGTGAGNRVRLLVREGSANSVEEGDRDGIATNTLGFVATQPDTNVAGIYSEAEIKFY